MAGLVRRIKAETPLAVTLSLGERDDDELAAWRRPGPTATCCGSRPPTAACTSGSTRRGPAGASDRIALLRMLRRLGYEVGSGVMIGIPGQTYDDLARDIELFRKLDLDMIGVGPYLLHPDTPLARSGRPAVRRPTAEQVPATELMTYKVIALARLVCPRANIPSTTALATLNLRSGRELGLVRGANVIMPNLTPPQYRVHYEIYPNKACIRETADGVPPLHRQAASRASAARSGRGRGDSPNYARRRATTDVQSRTPCPSADRHRND